MKQRLYFGHPVNVYDTTLERILLVRIAAAFPDWEIENPNQQRHQEGYERYKRERGNGMRYYSEEVLPHCQGGVFLPFRDGAWGAGVYLEAQVIKLHGGMLWTIDHDRTVRRCDLAKVRVLTIEETRTRIRGTDGKPLPF